MSTSYGVHTLLLCVQDLISKPQSSLSIRKFLSAQNMSSFYLSLFSLILEREQKKDFENPLVIS